MNDPERKNRNYTNLSQLKPFFLFLATCVALVSVFYWCVATPMPTRGDETDYYLLAHSIQKGIGYCIERQECIPTRFPPIYPLVLSWVLTLEAYTPLLLTLPSVIAFLGTLLAIFSLFKDSPWRHWILLLYAGHFYSVYLIVRLRSEHLFMLFSYGTFCFFHLFTVSRKYRYLILAFLLSTFSAYTRTIGWILPACILIMLLNNKYREAFWIVFLGTVAALTYYLKLTDTVDYLLQIDQLSKNGNSLYKIGVDILIHFGRNVIDFFSGFWTPPISFSNSLFFLFTLKTICSFLISVVILSGLFHKVTHEGFSIEDIFFLVYPLIFCVLGIYGDMYRYFLPMFPLCLSYFIIGLIDGFHIKSAHVTILLYFLLFLYLAKILHAANQINFFYN